MLRHLVGPGPALAWEPAVRCRRSTGRDRLAAAGARMPTENCLRRKQAVPEMIIAVVLVGNLCGNNPGTQAAERSTRRGPQFWDIKRNMRNRWSMLERVRG